MKNLFALFFIIPFSALSQSFQMPNIEDFVAPNPTGSNMTVGLLSPNFDPYVGGTIGAFYDLNGDGLLQCVGAYTVTTGFMGMAVWGDETTTPEKDGLATGDIPSWFISFDDEIYYLMEVPEFPGYQLNGISMINGGTIIIPFSGCTNPYADNYDSSANFDDGSCYRYGCTSLWADNYDPYATIDDGSCYRFGCTSYWADNYDTYATADDGSCFKYGCMQPNDCNYDYLATIDPGTSCVGAPGCMEPLYMEYTDMAGCNNPNLCLTTWEDAYYTAQEKLAYLSSPIPIDLLLGWNIIGYTKREPQDLVATLQEITDIIELVKNNAAQVYWPEYGFNGIGDLIPGQGYQVKVTEEYSGFTYLDTEGQRIELTPTVPQWAIDMEVEMHPNDIRTLVRVVNLLGQEVNPEMEPRGSVLLYLYNDATVEKKLVE